MAYTQAELRDKVRKRTDMENNPHLSDDKLDDYLEYSIEDLYDLIVSIDESYFKKSNTSITTTSGTQEYNLPADFYKLLSVNAKRGSEYWNVTRYSHTQRNKNSLTTDRFKYDLSGSKIKFVPTPDANTEIKLEYIGNPDTTEWTLDQFSEYLIVSAGIMALEDEESDASHLERRLVKLEQRIARYVKRDDAEPAMISDRLNNSFNIDEN